MPSQIKKSRALIFQSLAFIGLILGLFYIFNLQDYLFLRPQGPHQFRQTDCTSMALMYANQDNGLLQPELHQLMSDNGTTGKSAGEFPLLYFAVGKLWKVTGQQEWLFRLINFSIFTLGLFGLYRICMLELKSSIMSLLIVTMLFTVPIFLYYAPNFLQNTTAFSFVLIAWFFIYKFYKTSNKWLAFWAIIFMTVAPLLKITAFISFLALFGLLVLNRLRPNLGLVKTVSKFQTRVALLGAFISIGFTTVWYAYVKYYVSIHKGWFSYNSLWPIWKMELDYINETLDWVYNVWLGHYFSVAGYIFLLFCIVIILIYRKQVPQFLKGMIGMVMLGNILYLVLWFNALHDHDYYLINLYPLPVLIWFTAMYVLKKVAIESVPSKILGYSVSFLLVFGTVEYGKFNLWYRYNGWMNDNGNNRYSAFFDVTSYLREELNIHKELPVLTYPDPSFSITLYLADQRGWPIRDNWPIDSISKRIEYGAQYALINDSTFYQKEGLDKYDFESVGRHKTIDILKIKKASP